jgi:hypothetical protein
MAWYLRATAARRQVRHLRIFPHAIRRVRPALSGASGGLVPLDGRAAVYSFTFYPHRDIDSADIRIGMEIELEWVFNADGWGLPAFRPPAVRP